MKKTQNLGNINLWQSCETAMTMTPRTQSKKLLQQYAIIGEQFRKKLDVYIRDIVSSVIFVAIIIFCPRLLNASRDIVGWIPTIEIFNSILPYIPFISVLVCGIVFSHTIFFMVKSSIEKNKAQNHLLECIHSQKNNHDFFSRIKRAENRNTILLPLIPSVIGTGVTVVITILGMVIKADPAWACVPVVTFAGSSIGPTVIIQRKSLNSDANTKKEIDDLESSTALVSKKTKDHSTGAMIMNKE